MLSLILWQNITSMELYRDHPKQSIETNDDEALPKRFKMNVAKGELPCRFDFIISEWQDDLAWPLLSHNPLNTQFQDSKSPKTNQLGFIKFHTG